MASLLGRACRLSCKQACQVVSRRQGLAAETGAIPSPLTPSQPWSSRGFAAGSGHGDTYAGLTLHKPGQWHRIATEVATGTMWFWLFVRFYHDGEALFFGHSSHYEHEAIVDHAHAVVGGHGSHDEEESQEHAGGQTQPAG